MDRRRYRLGVAALAVVAGLAVGLLATRLFPYHSLNHDEAVYLQQAAMLLEGQLALYPPIEDALRPWFFVSDGGRLYPKYAPVPAAMFAVGRLLGGYRVALVLIAAGNVALVAGVTRRVFDRRTGLVAAAFVLASPLFLIDSSVFLPYAPTTLLNLAFAYAYVRADGTGDHRWAAGAGAAIGLAFFARPYTAVLFAAPFVVHALWTCSAAPRRAVPRQAVTASLGTAGVAVALGYNALQTGSPWVFPFEAFAPRDGIGFGTRRILGHEVQYTPELALRANWRVLELLFTEWIAGGLLGAGLAGLGVAVALRRPPRARVAVLAGLGPSIAAGNLFFWGNYNILGSLTRSGDGLVAAFGPYYHFDLLLPTAAFAAVGGWWLVDRAHGLLSSRLDRRTTRVAMAGLVVIAALPVGGVTAAAVDRPVGENLEATRTYADAYEPFEGGSPANAVVLLPDPYGDWLNHPFQPLRNDPGYDGRTLYAIDDRPFAVADAFPDRRLYRYGYRGRWAPYDGSPEAAVLRRVRDVRARRVALEATLGVPPGAVGVTVRVATDAGSVYYVAPNVTSTLSVGLAVTDERVRASGEIRPVAEPTVALAGSERVRVTVFVDYGGGGAFAYRLTLPVRAGDDRVRALSPRVEHCRDARACGGEATYVPAAAPEGVFVRTRLHAGEPNP